MGEVVNSFENGTSNMSGSRGRHLRDCAVCGGPVFARQHQADSARACKPICAKTLAVKEHPDIDKVGLRDSGRGPE